MSQCTESTCQHIGQVRVEEKCLLNPVVEGSSPTTDGVAFFKCNDPKEKHKPPSGSVPRVFTLPVKQEKKALNPAEDNTSLPVTCLELPI